MVEDFEAAVEEGLRLSKIIYFGKDRAVAPPNPPLPMDRSTGHLYLPTSPMLYVVIGDRPLVPSDFPNAISGDRRSCHRDNPDMPSYQPHVHGRCDSPALIPLQLNRISLEVDCFMDTAFSSASGSWHVHCVMAIRGCDCRIVVPMGEQGSILDVEAETPRKSYCTQLIAIDNEGGTENEAFLKAHIFAFTVPKIDGGTNISVKLRWSQKLIYEDGQFTLNIPFSFPECVTPAGKKIPKHEKIELNLNSGPGTEITCETASHPLKEQLRQAGKLSFLYEFHCLHGLAVTFRLHTHPSMLLDVDDRKMFCCYLYPGKKRSEKAN